MLPCNVVVTGVDEATSTVEVFDPMVMTSFVEDPELLIVAAEARGRLAGMIEALGTYATTIAATERWGHDEAGA